jgi:hypothetical protein
VLEHLQLAGAESAPFEETKTVDDIVSSARIVAQQIRSDGDDSPSCASKCVGSWQAHGPIQHAF